MKVKLLVLLISFFPISSSFSQFFKVLESDNNHIKIKINFDKTYAIKEKIIGLKSFNYIEGGISFRKRGEPWLPSEDLKIGVPLNSNPTLSISNIKQEKTSNIYIIPCPDSLNQSFEKLFYDASIYQSNNLFPKISVEDSYFIMRYIRVASLELSPYQYNPVSRELIFNKSFIINISFNRTDGSSDFLSSVNDKLTEEFAASLINPIQAKNFITQKNNVSSDRMLVNDSLWYNPSKGFLQSLS